MAVQIDIVYQGSLHCQVVHGPSGAALQTDAPVDNGGKGQSFSPTDLVASALGSCMLTIMGLEANRRGLDLLGTQVRVEKHMINQPVRRIDCLRVRMQLPSALFLSPEDRAALQRAAERCPVKQSLHPDIRIELEIL